MRLVILGPQGAGKGTQAKRISEKYGIPHIATGDIFRWAMKQGDQLGEQVKEYVDDGRLVPDALTLKVVTERLDEPDAADGWILDGFPRNPAQAEGLEDRLAAKGNHLDAVLVMEVPEDVSLRRALGRRVCEDCGANYHVDDPPRQDWTCDRCGGRVVPRSDDSEEKVRNRLRTYWEHTAPLKDFYRERDRLIEIDGRASPDDVFAHIVSAL